MRTVYSFPPGTLFSVCTYIRENPMIRTELCENVIEIQYEYALFYRGICIYLLHVYKNQNDNSNSSRG